MLALVMLAVPLEHTYGPLRVFAIFLSAGAFIQASVGPSCKQQQQQISMLNT